MELPKDLSADASPTPDWLRHTELLNVALGYADLGWRVFPIRCPVDTKSGVRCSCGDPECNPGKHPYFQNPYQSVSKNPAKIEEWWADHPDANIGIPTGRPSEIVVLDEDPRNGGDSSLERLEKEHGPLPKTVTAKTGGGGRHFYFRYSGGEIKSGALDPDNYPGIDIQVDKVCVVAPPSLHKTGNKYEWVEGLEPHCTELAPLPGWILKQIRNKKTKKTTGGKGQADQLSQTPIFTKGYRNSSMMRAAGSVNQFCCTGTEIFQHLVLFNRNRCEPPLPESQVKSVANSACKYRTDSPADLILAIWTPDIPLKAREKSVLSTLIKMCDWTTWKCFPSHKTIGESAGMGTSSVQRALHGLKEKGFVSWTQPGRGSNNYQVHRDKIIQYQTASNAILSKSDSSPHPPLLDSKSYRPTDRGCGQAEERVESLCDSPDDGKSDPDPSPVPPDT